MTAQDSLKTYDAAPGIFRKVLWQAQAVLLQGGTFLCALVPLALIPVTGRLLGAACYHLLGSRRRVALENVTASLPFLPPGSSPERIARGCFVNLATSFLENCKLYHGFAAILDGVTIEGLENYRAAKAKGKGVMFLTGHCGNWEFIALTFGHRHDPFVVMVREQKNPYLTRIIERMRSRYGNTIIYKKGALREMMRVLRSEGVTGMLIDQAVMPTEGYQVDFLGRPAWTTSIPVLMSRKTGVPLLPAFISRREGGGHQIVIYPEVIFPTNDENDDALARDTALLTGYVERYVREHPEEWYWIHRRWKARDGSSPSEPPYRGER